MPRAREMQESLFGMNGSLVRLEKNRQTIIRNFPQFLLFEVGPVLLYGLGPELGVIGMVVAEVENSNARRAPDLNKNLPRLVVDDANLALEFIDHCPESLVLHRGKERGSSLVFTPAK